jgi:hypothetical protein
MTTGIDWYPPGTNAFTAHAALKAYVPPHTPGKRRKLLPIDPSLTDEKRRAIKNKRNRELMAAKRAALRVNAPTAFNTPITPKVERGTSANSRAMAAI